MAATSDDADTGVGKMAQKATAGDNSSGSLENNVGSTYGQEHARIEAWLDEHQEFFQDYLIRKGRRGMIDAWLLAHALPAGVSSALQRRQRASLNDGAIPGAPGQGSSEEDQDDHDDEEDVSHSAKRNASGVVGGTASSPSRKSASSRSVSGGSRPGSGSGTPVRKISAHEFERGGLNKPLVATIDGAPTFLSPPSPSEPCSGQIRKRSRYDVQGLNETDLIFELVKDICNDLDVRRLCHKILQNVGILTNADRCSLFLVQGEGDSRCLVSDLFDISSHSTVEEMNKKTEIRVGWGQGIVGHVAQSGHVLNIPDVYQDERFNQEVDNMTGYRTRSMLCHPIKDAGSGEVLGVAQVINKANDGVFSANDESVFEKYLQFCGIGLRNAQLYERSQLEVKRNQVLLDLAGVIFHEQSTIDTLIFRILTHMLSLIRCERALLLLVHETSQGTFSRVFDLESADLENDSLRAPYEGRFPINAGITGYVAATGETVNIPDAYKDHRFDPAVDSNNSAGKEAAADGLNSTDASSTTSSSPSSSSFKHKSILCMPIVHGQATKKNNGVLGVFQLVNKFDDLAFTKNDENFVEAFAIFCGMGISNVRNFERAVIAMAKQQVTLEVLSYHAVAPVKDAVALARKKIPSAAALQLNSFSFDDFALSDDETLQAALRMFIDLDLPGRFHMDYTLLCRWLISVKKNYRDVTYHNWRHAFNVAQMMFALITATQWWKRLGEVECLSLMIACLCHDLDHRGTNNSFQQKSSSSLAQLYSTSTMEHHHFDQCVMLLNSKGTTILANLSGDEFRRTVSVLEDAILATDLAVYFRRREETFNLLKKKDKQQQQQQLQSVIDWGSEHSRSLLRGMMMTACDLAAITKPWEIQKKVAHLVSAEFFFQGDLEKTHLHLQPIDMMNRDKTSELPAMQVDFVDQICAPVYDCMSSASPALAPLAAGCAANRAEWQRLADEERRNREERRAKGGGRDKK